MLPPAAIESEGILLVQYNLADLHSHSTCSDGQRTPRQVVAEAADAGVRVLSLTDHDTVKGVGGGRSRPDWQLGVEIVPGTELSVHVNERELHLLAYFIDYLDERLGSYVELLHRQRRERGEAIVHRLNQLGVGGQSRGGPGQVRGWTAWDAPHIAAAMVASGAVPTKEEAFQHFLGDPPARLRAETAEPGRRGHPTWFTSSAASSFSPIPV